MSTFENQRSRCLSLILKKIGTLSVCVFTGCGSNSSTSASKAFDFPTIASIVSGSTPAGLKSSTTANNQIRQIFDRIMKITFTPPAFAAAASVSNVTASLTGIFKGTFAKISGGSGTGYINANLEDLDSRVTELENRFTTLPSCFSKTLSSLTVDFSNHSDAQLTLKVNCRDEFTWKAGDAGAPGSGMVFGKQDKTSTSPEVISLMLLLKHQTTSADGGTDSYDAGFGYAGTVTGYGTSEEAVEMLFGQFNTKSSLSASDQDQPLMARIYTKTASKSFELVLASTMPSSGGPISGGSSNLGCGFRLISDGSIIVAKGNYLANGTCAGGTPDTVDICVDATTLADVSSTSSAACTTLAATKFHIASSTTSLNTFTSSTLTTVNASTHIFNALKPGSTSVKAITNTVTN